VREDLPTDLLIAVTLGMGAAMDAWLVSQQIDDASLPKVIGSLISMLRGAVGA
jgi:hypothetical protein